MRISTEKQDGGYELWNTGRFYDARIYLNDEEQYQVITADDELGYIKKYKTDDFAGVVVVPGTNELAVEELHGKVLIAGYKY